MARSISPPRSAPPAGHYNLAGDLLGRNLALRPDKVAFIDPDGHYTYADVADRAGRAGAALRGIGSAPGDRVVLCLPDGIDFVAAFLGAIRVGIVPIALNTLFPAADYAHILLDSDARAAIVPDALAPRFDEAIAASGWRGRLIVSGSVDGHDTLGDLMAATPDGSPVHPTDASDIAFWLYSSGSTGRPKGAPHRHASPVRTAELFARDVFGLAESDIVFSAAKLFFAYGLGNALTFPMTLGATAVLCPERVTPDIVARILAEHRVSIFCGVPTLYGALLASPDFPPSGISSLRRCLSAGEALPEEIGRAWTARTGTEIVDGIGSTEMLHIYVANRPGAVRHGTTGRPVPGYDVKLVDEGGGAVDGEGIGELWVRGPTMTTGYWRQPERSAATFIDGWMRSGDKFQRHADGCLTHCGRNDDMLKISGIWVSPSEVENALLAHECVLEAAVIGVVDAAGLTKVKAFVVPRAGMAGDNALADQLRAFTKARLAPYKYPRLIAFVEALPKTPTGKIRRHLLREREAGLPPIGGGR